MKLLRGRREEPGNDTINRNSVSSTGAIMSLESNLTHVIFDLDGLLVGECKDYLPDHTGFKCFFCLSHRDASCQVEN